jgi:hypothetical protein
MLSAQRMSACSARCIAQFGQSFSAFGTLRRRRAEHEHPTYAGEAVEADEVQDALTTAGQIIDGAAQLIPFPTIFA